jgi:hypothetical protein
MTKVTVGELVVVTGTGCPVEHWGLAFSPAVPAPRRSSPDGLVDEEGLFDTGSNGFAGGIVGRQDRWKMTGIVPMVPPGPTELGGSCTPNESG